MSVRAKADLPAIRAALWARRSIRRARRDPARSRSRASRCRCRRPACLRRTRRLGGVPSRQPHTCLEQAVVLQAWRARFGSRRDVVIGVRGTGEAFERTRGSTASPTHRLQASSRSCASGGHDVSRRLQVARRRSVLGVDPVGLPGEVPDPGAALERAACRRCFGALPRQLLRRPRLLGVLAVAARAARRQGLPLPIPATNRFRVRPGPTRTSGRSGRLPPRLDDWLRIDHGGELDCVGPVAARCCGGTASLAVQRPLPRAAAPSGVRRLAPDRDRRRRSARRRDDDSPLAILTGASTRL